MPRSDLPFGSEFSPSQIDLRQVLELAHEFGGDWKAFEGAIHDTYFRRHDTSEYNRRKLANNTKLAMVAYRIIDRDARLTHLGGELYATRDDADALYTLLARHILKDLHGTTLVQCVLDMEAGAESVDLEKLRAWLQERGIHFPRGGKHPSIMRLWLEKAGVFTSGWRVNEEHFREVLGISTDEIELLAQLTSEQRAYLKALANMSSPGPFPSNDVEKLAAATYGIKFSEKGLPKTVLYPLSKLGYISLARGTKTQGRGAKPFMVRSTPKLQADLIAPLLAQLEQQTDSDIRPLLRRPLPAILSDLQSSDKHTRGLALEALAFKLMRLIDLNYVATRLRGTATGGAEVDVIFESSRLVFSRWQVQCKNTDRVSLDDVAKEVGLTYLLGGRVIVLATTGEFTADAREYAAEIRRKLRVNICLVSGAELQLIATHPGAIVELLDRQAPLALFRAKEVSGREQNGRSAALAMGA